MEVEVLMEGTVERGDNVLSELQGKKHRSLKGFLRQTQLHPFCLVQTEALKVTASRKHSPSKGPFVET